MHDNDSQLFTIPLKFKIKLLDFTVLKFHLQYYIFFFFFFFFEKCFRYRYQQHINQFDCPSVQEIKVQ